MENNMLQLDKSDNRQEELKKIEADLASHIRRDISTWVEMYLLMDRVQTEQLYQGVYPSFTSWINHMADETGLHVSLFWKRLKAGQAFKTYAETADSSRDRGTAESSQDSVIENSASEPWQDRMLRLSKSKKLPAESLELCGKIAGKDKQMLSHMVDSLINGQLSRSELKEAYRQKQENKKETVKIEEPGEERSSDTEKTAAIKAVIRKNSNWIPLNPDSSKFKKIAYTVLEEVAVPTSNTQKPRRIDSLVIETRSTKFASDLCLHGIEIKVSMSDLRHDFKMGEYVPFVDAFWIAVPEDEELIGEVMDIKNESWGVLAVEPKTGVRIVEPAKKSVYVGKLRVQGLQAALRKIILSGLPASIERE